MANIYFIENANNCIKIGVTGKTVEKRLSELQVGNSDRLKLLYTIENVPTSFEKHIHGICEKYLVSGEWFEKEAINHLMKTPWFVENLKKYRPKTVLLQD